MLSIQNSLKNYLVKKRITNESIWYMCISIIENFFDKKIKISWKIKNNILIINTNPKYMWSEIYKNKNVLLEKINNSFNNIWINRKIDNIIIK